MLTQLDDVTLVLLGMLMGQAVLIAVCACVCGLHWLRWKRGEW